MGVKVLVDLWLEVIDRQEPVYEPVHLLGEPLPVLPPPSDSGQQSLPTREELELELDEIFDKEEDQERV